MPVPDFFFFFTPLFIYRAFLNRGVGWSGSADGQRASWCCPNVTGRKKTTANSALLQLPRSFHSRTYARLKTYAAEQKTQRDERLMELMFWSCAFHVNVSYVTGLRGLYWRSRSAYMSKNMCCSVWRLTWFLWLLPDGSDRPIGS